MTPPDVRAVALRRGHTLPRMIGQHRRREEAIPTGTPARSRFEVDPLACAVMISARSNVGAVRFGTRTIRGIIDVVPSSDGVDLDSQPRARLEIPLSDLTSGNALYDSELQQRLDVRRFPLATLDLTEARVLGDLDYGVDGTVTLHGVAATLRGNVTLQFPEPGVLTVTGEHVVDIRDFDIDLPTVLMLRLYPDVRVSMQLLARQIDHTEESS